MGERRKGFEAVEAESTASPRGGVLGALRLSVRYVAGSHRTPGHADFERLHSHGHGMEAFRKSISALSL